MPSTSASTAKVIHVSYDDATEQLSVAKDPSALESGETVLWSFATVPKGYLPMVLFGDRQGLGPFAALRQTEDQMWGEGNIGVASGTEVTYTYRAALIPASTDDDSSMITSEPVTLTNRGEKNSTPTVEVAVDLEAGTFEIEPERCTVFNGDAVLFRFTGLTESYTPSIVFKSYRPKDSTTSESSPHFGPFTTFCHEENAILGNGSNELIGSFEYSVVLFHLVDGELKAKKLYRSDDPFVDREEDPIV